MSQSSNHLNNSQSFQKQNSNQPPAQTTQQDKKQNIVNQNIFKTQPTTSSNQTNIFRQPIQQNEQKRSENIFFQAQNQQAKINIFGQATKSVNLFNVRSVQSNQNNNNTNNNQENNGNGQDGNNNMVKNEPNQFARTADEDDQKEDSIASSFNRKDQEKFKSTPEIKQMQHKYPDNWTIVKSYNLRKFKIGDKNAKQQVYMTFQTNKNHQGRLFIFVRAPQTKIIFFQGFGERKISKKTTNFMNREDNIKLFVGAPLQTEDGPDWKQLRKEEIKLQFETIADAKDFKEFVEKEFAPIEEKPKTQTANN